MKGNKKLRGILALMILSELLLLFFLGSWISGQFEKESTMLKEELSRQFLGSKEQVLDSMIVMRYIDPLLKDKRGFKVKMLTEDSALEEGRIVEKRTFDLSASLSLGEEIPDSCIRVFSKKIPGSKNPADSVLLKGVKLLINEITFPRGDSVKMDWQLSGSDTALMHKIMSEKMHTKGLNFTMKWNSGKSEENSQIVLRADHLPAGLGMAIGQYKFYVWKKIAPQAIFALVLLLLCGTAFIISYRSLAGQIRLNVLKNDFISNISHELKTPVSTVKVAVEALQKGDFQNDTVKTQDYLRMAALEIERLELLISKVLNDSLLENGNMMLDLERTELTKLVNETIHLLHIRFSEANASVHFEKGNEELFTNIDRLHIQGVLVNILDNSLKYADSAPKIEIRSGLLNGKIFISVKDNGPGIPEEYKNKIFEKFFRVPAHDKHNVKGYGLGLSYATLIMKQHRGEISVVNNTDAGCTFTLFFPSA